MLGEFGDDSLRAAIDNVLSRDPDDLPVRFVALNAYYRLMSLEEPEVIEFAAGGEPLTRKNILKHLGYLVRIRDPTTCTNTIDIRWEIANAFAVKDYSRMLVTSSAISSRTASGITCAGASTF